MTTNKPVLLNCPACGAPLDFDGTSPVIRCKFCGNRSLVDGSVMDQPSENSSALGEIRALINNGAIDDAVSHFQQQFGVSSNVARLAVEALQNGRVASFSMDSKGVASDFTPVRAQIAKLLTEGSRDQALALYRQHFGTDLTHAVQAIDYITEHIDSSSHADFPAITPIPAATQARVGKLTALIAGISIFIISLGIFLFLSSSGALAKHYIPMQPMIFLPAAEDGSVLLASSFYDPDKDIRFAGLIDPQNGKLLWHGEAFNGDSMPRVMIGSSTLLYTAVDADLFAYSLDDGSIAWQTVMPDNLAYGQTPMLLTAGRLITANEDQSIQAYDSISGRLVWQRQLTSNDSNLRLIDNQLVVMDGTGQQYQIGVFFIDPVTGIVKQTLTPSCDTGFTTYDMDLQTQFIEDTSEHTMWVIFRQGCIKKLDLASMSFSWSSTYPDWFDISLDEPPYLLTDSNLYLANGSSLLMVNKNNGEIKAVVENESYDFVPLTIIDRTLILRAKRTRGSERFELWGVDANSGEQKWQMDLKTGEPIDEPDAMVGLVDKEDWGWTWSQAGNGFSLLTFKGEPPQLVLESFDPATGASQGQTTFDLKRVYNDFYSVPTRIGYQGSIIYMDVDGTIFSLDLASGELKLIY